MYIQLVLTRWGLLCLAPIKVNYCITRRGEEGREVKGKEGLRERERERESEKEVDEGSASVGADTERACGIATP